MTSDDSDDEPLSKFVSNRKKTASTIPQAESPEPVKRKKRKRRVPRKVLKVIGDQVQNLSTISRPADAWLYLKDLNPTGPYSCLLCNQFFTNRFKVAIHYILDHKKDYCGICRYFVPNREAWLEHQKEHSPWPCSQCTELFDEEYELRSHLSKAHKLVHCKLCHFQVTDGDEYYDHLSQKHNVSDAACIEEDILWEVVNDGVQKFHCFLCTKSNILGSLFYNHFMALHHVNLKCLTNMLSGKNLSLQVPGIHLSQQFIVNELKSAKFGYGAIDNQTVESAIPEKTEVTDFQDSSQEVVEIKNEVGSDDEVTNSSNTEPREQKAEISEGIYKDYKGDEDFDVTAVELIIMERCYFDYAEKTVNDINSNIISNVEIEFEKIKPKNVGAFRCTLCNTIYDKTAAFAHHYSKMHCVKCLPIYCCRMCSTIFETRTELDSHLEEEKKDFEELWLCQFCDEEFNNRQSTRYHLLEHRDMLDTDNCFSPHLGFKCKYCPTLFWNEPDRETHQLAEHCEKLKNKHYKCHYCYEIFSEKLWFIHHYLNKHDKEKTFLFKCTLCCLAQPNIEMMRTHFNEFHPEHRKFFCSLESCCFRPLSTRKSFGTHLKTVHSPNSKLERRVKCTICNKDFPNGRACGGHMVAVHGQGKFKCKVCNELMQTRDERKLHYMIRHPGHNPYECNECNKSFMYKSTLYMHKQQHGDQKTYTCNFCAKVFNKKDSFREHLQIHGGPRHACSYCPMKFVQRSNMLRHERRHTGERPYACQYCPRTFADKGACNSHTRTHLNVTPFTCMYCGQTFAQKSKLTYHIRKHTGENLETCTVCSKLFTSACSLREHMKTHGNEKVSIKCPVCGNTYRDERYMTRHLRSAHSNRYFNCPLCKRGFTTPSAMKQHVWSHSKINAFKCKYCKKSYSIQRTVMKHLKKRHGVKGAFAGMREFIEKIDPRDCGFDLDEETITNIFGPREENTGNDMVIANFVAITNKLLNEKARMAASSQKADNTSDEDDDEESEGEVITEEPIPLKEVEHVSIKLEPTSDEETNFEPSDFVSVKIEPIDTEN